MASVQALIERYFASVGGELVIGGAGVAALAGQYGTPFFVYDREVIETKWRQLRDALPAVFSICYSVKANPSQAVLGCLMAQGAGLEIASGGEFVQALRAGCKPEQIFFAGPGKTDADLELVLSQGIGEIHVESALEARRISDICRRLKVRGRVSVRVNPSGEAEGGAMRMGGRPAPFGVDEESLDGVLDQLLSYPELDFRGLHLFAGTQILDCEILASQYRKGIEIARRIATRIGRPLDTVDFGGGLGVPYFAHEQELDMAKLKITMAALGEEIDADPLLRGTRCFVEPGRYLVAEAGVYVTRVLDVKVSRGKKFLVVDGGMHHHLAASGNLGQTIKRNYPVAVVNKLDRDSQETVDIVGPLCTPLDVLARGILVPECEAGDLVGVFQSGAYARSASPAGFLSHATPPEVWVERTGHRLIRRRGDYSDYLRDQEG